MKEPEDQQFNGCEAYVRLQRREIPSADERAVRGAKDTNSGLREQVAGEKASSASSSSSGPTDPADERNSDLLGVATSSTGKSSMESDPDVWPELDPDLYIPVAIIGRNVLRRIKLKFLRKAPFYETMANFETQGRAHMFNARVSGENALFRDALLSFKQMLDCVPVETVYYGRALKQIGEAMDAGKNNEEAPVMKYLGECLTLSHRLQDFRLKYDCLISVGKHKLRKREEARERGDFFEELSKGEEAKKSLMAALNLAKKRLLGTWMDFVFVEQVQGPC